jgi:hypothetical protein
MENEIIIEDQIPLPDRAHRQQLYPALYTMEVGQSFARPMQEREALHNAGQQCRKKTGRKFAIRRTDLSTVRIWRLL